MLTVEPGVGVVVEGLLDCKLGVLGVLGYEVEVLLGTVLWGVLRDAFPPAPEAPLALELVPDALGFGTPVAVPVYGMLLIPVADPLPDADALTDVDVLVRLVELV